MKKKLPPTDPEDIFSPQEQDDVLLSLEYNTEYFPSLSESDKDE